MTFEERRAATKVVIGWIIESCGDAAADYWAWERTPMPCDLPSDEQLDEGIEMAVAGPTGGVEK